MLSGIFAFHADNRVKHPRDAGLGTELDFNQMCFISIINRP